MFIIIAALVVGIAIFIWLLHTLRSEKQRGADSKTLRVLRVILVVEAAAFIVVFAIVFIKMFV